MRVAVVTVNYCCAAEILRHSSATLAEIRSCDGTWWIVDNNSPDKSYAQVIENFRESPDVHVIKAERNGGFGYGNNRVIDKVLGGEIDPQYVYFLNPDAHPEPGSVGKMISYLDQNPDVGVIGSGLLNEDGSHTDSMFRFPSIFSEIEQALAFGPVSRALADHRVSLGALSEPRRVDWVAGTSFMIRSQVLRRVGGFDEDFFLYWEEVELCHRVAEAGIAVHGLPTAKVRHVGGVSTGMHRPERRMPGYWHDSRNLYFRKTKSAGPVGLLNAITALCLALRRCIELARGMPMNPPRFLRDHIKHAFGRSRPLIESAGG